MIRLAFAYLGISFIAPVLFLLAFSGGSLLVTGLMALPLVVTTFAYLWLVLEVARRDGLLSRNAFFKCSLICGLSALLLVAGSTELLVHFAPAVNLGAALSDFRMFYFVYSMALPTLIYTAITGLAFWYMAVRNNSYIKPYSTEGKGKWFTLPRTKPSAIRPEEKKAA